jgi:hypothetical protein
MGRLDILHHVGLLLLKDKLHLAPIGSNPQRILDIGTGTGIWAIDCGEYVKYPPTFCIIYSHLQKPKGAINPPKSSEQI